MSEDGRIVPGTLSLPPASYGVKNEDTTRKGGRMSDFYGELSDILTRRCVYDSLINECTFAYNNWQLIRVAIR